MAFRVTPWEVEGDVDYQKLMKEFGVKPLTKKLLQRIKAHTGELHYMLRRGIFISHRDLNWLLDEYEKGNKFFLYTGRGPSGHTHLGHLIPWIFTKWLQDKFKAELYFQMTDDEKFLFNQKLSLKQANSFAYENALDVIALGFKPGLTKIIIDSECAGVLYPLAIKVAKRLTFSVVKAVFGFKNSTNVGSIFFTSVQAVPAFLPSVLKGKNIPCLIPHGIDQDPHFRVSRDILPKLGYYKPASIHNIFFPSLKQGNKMSASLPDTAIFTTDTPELVKRKIWNAFTGGRESIEQQRRLGGNPEICPVFKYYFFLFERDDAKLEERRQACMQGKLLCGECKQELIKRVNAFLEEHQKKRKQAKGSIKKYLFKR
ncbi:tryptophan--tRNA ligase [Candidatus Woesearchaeota archaeon]|nr:MAG: tryptophan--tRNA ligase [Candidatus Woesearchaeota archaeon]